MGHACLVVMVAEMNVVVVIMLLQISQIVPYILFCDLCFYGNKVSPYTTVIGCASKFFETFQLEKAQKYSVTERVNKSDLRCKAPKNGFVKINWDTVVDKNRRKMYIGVVVRDDMGEVMATLSAPKYHIIEPDIAEAFVALTW